MADDKGFLGYVNTGANVISAAKNVETAANTERAADALEQQTRILRAEQKARQTVDSHRERLFQLSKAAEQLSFPEDLESYLRAKDTQACLAYEGITSAALPQREDKEMLYALNNRLNTIVSQTEQKHAEWLAFREEVVRTKQVTGPALQRYLVLEKAASLPIVRRSLAGGLFVVSISGFFFYSVFAENGIDWQLSLIVGVLALLFSIVPLERIHQGLDEAPEWTHGMLPDNPSPENIRKALEEARAQLPPGDPEQNLEACEEFMTKTHQRCAYLESCRWYRW